MLDGNSLHCYQRDAVALGSSSTLCGSRAAPRSLPYLQSVATVSVRGGAGLREHSTKAKPNVNLEISLEQLVR